MLNIQILMSEMNFFELFQTNLYDALTQTPLFLQAGHLCCKSKQTSIEAMTSVLS